MSKLHFVRIGVMGQVGRFSAGDAVCYPRASRVICRTDRGLEVGSVLTPANSSCGDGAPDGVLIRGMTTEDELLLARLEKHKIEAYEACQKLLVQRKLPAVLVDVEHLFDGQSLYFYFLGEVTQEIEALTGQLADAYETKVQFRKFTETLTQGCGPACGTEDAAGCGSSCSSCSIAGACAVGK